MAKARVKTSDFVKALEFIIPDDGEINGLIRISYINNTDAKLVYSYRNNSPKDFKKEIEELGMDDVIIDTCEIVSPILKNWYVEICYRIYESN